MSDRPRELAGWRAEAIVDVRTAHRRVRTAEEELRCARKELKERALGARRLGLTLQQVGEVMGVSRQRVHELTR